MTFEQLRALVAVVDHGGFSRAALSLGLGQSTISAQIKTLETSLGARLVDRRGRTLRPTSTGRAVLQKARRLLALAEETRQRARAEGQSGGQLTIAASTIPAEYILPPLLAELAAKDPALHFTVDVSDSRRAARALLDESCDLAVVGSPLPDQRIEWHPCAEDEVVLVGPTVGPHGDTKSLPTDGLATVPLVLREQGSGTREAASGFVDPAAEASPRATRIQVGSTEAARRCVLAGLGFSFISRLAVADDLAAGRLRLVRLAGTPLRRSFHVGRLRTVSPSPPAAALLAALLPRRRSRG